MKPGITAVIIIIKRFPKALDKMNSMSFYFIDGVCAAARFDVRFWEACYACLAVGIGRNGAGRLGSPADQAVIGGNKQLFLWHEPMM